MRSSDSLFGKWLDQNDVTIAHCADKTGVSYRTVWLAVRGKRVSYQTAKILHLFTGRKVSIDAFCSAPPLVRYSKRASGGKA
jgi:hypothetical protein